MLNALTEKRTRGSMLWDYLTTVDHKKIAILYLVAGGFFFLVGGIEAMFIRIQLAKPENAFLSAQAYNEVMTMHGTTMIFLAAMPLLFALMNAVVPLQIGARDVSFPFLNALGFWLFFFGGIFLNLSWFLGGAPDAGWTSYASLSLHSKGHGIDFFVLGLQISGLGTLIAGINFFTTIINMRAPGMTYMRLPLFTWTTFVVSALILFAFPPLTVGLALMMLDRLFGTNFFNPELGGNTVIWEHLFWIFTIRGLYLNFACIRYFFRGHPCVCQKAFVWVLINGFCHRAHRLFGLYGLGAPHVHDWSWADCKCDFCGCNNGYRDSDRD